MRFDPEKYPGRTIVIDYDERPPAEKMNCLGCGKLTEVLWRGDELCGECYERWSLRILRAK